MSYLLDALRKAEQERKLGQPPTLNAATAVTPERRVWDRRIYVGLVTLSAALGLLAIALLLTRERPPPDTAQAAATAPQPAPAPAPGPKSFDDLGIRPAPDAAAEPSTAVPLNRPPALPTPQPPPQPLKVADASAESAPLMRESSAVELLDGDATLHAALEAPAPVADLREMPLEYRAGFPTPSIEVHVYEPQAERRWILSGGRRYREGDTLPQGPRVAEITRDAVVFDFRGQQARVPVGR